MFQGFFSGRNGIDLLSIFILCLAVPFFSFHYLWMIGVLLILYALFRAFSRNIDKRRRELWLFTDVLRKIQIALQKLAWRLHPFTIKVKKRFAFWGIRIRQRKEYVFFRCPKCKNVLRLPRHRGKLAVTCTVCGHSFQKKT